MVTGLVFKLPFTKADVEMPKDPVAHKGLDSLIWKELSDVVVTRAQDLLSVFSSLSFLPTDDFLNDGYILTLLCVCSFISGYHWSPPVPKAVVPVLPRSNRARLLSVADSL